jgi:hypothetical protein
MAQSAFKQTSRLLGLAALLSSACDGSLTSPLGPDADGPGLGSSTEDVNGDGIPDGPGANGGVNGSSQELNFECKPDARSSEPLRRLSRSEYVNSLRDVITAQTSAATATSVMSGAASPLTGIPTDSVTKHAPFARMDPSVSQQHVEAYFNVAQNVATALTSSDARVAELLGSCSTATGAAGATCVDNFIANFGKRALRHPLNTAEKAFYKQVYAVTSGVDKAGLADVLVVFLTSPSFLYEVQFGADAVTGQNGLYELNDFEIASRLSFEFWQTTPDDELLAAAESGDLTSDAGFSEAVDHVLENPRAAKAIEQFAREWFGLDSMRALDSLATDPVFKAFAGANLPSATLKEDMIKEFTESLSFHAFVKNETMRDWVESPFSFARSKELASIYGIDAWNGQGDPPVFPDGERAGLVTRAALLATGSANTRPIMKGVTIRERLLCDTLDPPPANAGNNPPELSPTLTTREVVETLTEQPGSSCASCHLYSINPLGFATENFDALGRARSEQKLFSATGSLVAEKPVDTNTTPQVWLGDKTPSTGPQDLTKQLADSGKVEACFARQFVRFAQGREEDEAVDGCALEAVRASLSAGENFRTALRKFALLPAFRQRLVAGDG